MSTVVLCELNIPWFEILNDTTFFLFFFFMGLSETILMITTPF